MWARVWFPNAPLPIHLPASELCKPAADGLVSALAPMWESEEAPHFWLLTGSALAACSCLQTEENEEDPLLPLLSLYVTLPSK